MNQPVHQGLGWFILYLPLRTPSPFVSVALKQLRIIFKKYIIKGILILDTTLAFGDKNKN